MSGAADIFARRRLCFGLECQQSIVPSSRVPSSKSARSSKFQVEGTQLNRWVFNLELLELETWNSGQRAHFMNRAVRATAITLVLLPASLASAQPGTPPAPEPATLRGDSTQTRKRLAEAEQKIIGGKAADAADDLQRLLDESA